MRARYPIPRKMCRSEIRAGARPPHNCGSPPLPESKGYSLTSATVKGCYQLTDGAGRKARSAPMTSTAFTAAAAMRSLMTLKDRKSG